MIEFELKKKKKDSPVVQLQREIPAQLRKQEE